MLFSIVPPALILPTIRPSVDPVPCLLVILELTFISNFVCVQVKPKTFHVVRDPLTVVNFPVYPILLAVAMNLVFLPLTLIHGSICERVFAFTVFEPILVLSFILGSTGKVFNAVSMLLVISPEPFISSACRSLVHTKLVRLVIGPLAVVSVA